jgi:hypothetical protein
MFNNQEYPNHRYVNFDHEINYADIVDDIIFSYDVYTKRTLFQLQRYINRCLKIFQFTGSGNTILISITFSFVFKIAKGERGGTGIESDILVNLFMLMKLIWGMGDHIDMGGGGMAELSKSKS